MKITSLLSNLILEQSRFKVLYDKLVVPAPGQPKQNDPFKKATPKGIMEFNLLKSMIFADPTTKAPENFDIEGASVQDMENVKVGKFVQWILKNFLKPSNEALSQIDDSLNFEELDTKSSQFKQAMKEFRRRYEEDLFKIKNELEEFEKIKQYLPEDQRDINKYTPQSLFSTLETFQLPEEKKKKKEKETLKKEIRKEREGFKHPGADIIATGDNYTLIKIDLQKYGEKALEAASWYGGFYDYKNGESNWCTSPPNSSYAKTYMKDGPLYVVLANDDKGKIGSRTGLPQERFQFHFPSNQFMDRADKPVNLVELLNGILGEFKEIFKPEFAKGLVGKGGNKVEINYPESSAGKFVALYGFDELFESLPDTLESLTVNNKSNENIALDIPQSIGRFKNMENLMLRNIVKSLPDSIGDLSNLDMLSLPNNLSLTKLPESLSKISNLSFINLRNSNKNIEIPQSLASKLNDEGDGFYFVS